MTTTKPKVVAVVQARMSSSRLPGKVLETIAGLPMVALVVDRVRQAKSVDRTLVATSVDASDDPIAEVCRQNEIPIARGSLNDVLDRFYHAAKAEGADWVVRITADCPLIDPDVIDGVVELAIEKSADYTSNCIPKPTFPDGLDVEVCAFSALEKSWCETNDAKRPADREHVTTRLRLDPGYVRAAFANDSDLGDLRWTVDEPADLAFVRAIYSHLNDRRTVRFREVLNLLNSKPEIARMQGEAVLNEGYYKTLFQQASAGSAPKPNLTKSLAWAERSRRVIPSIAQTISKGTSQYVQGVSPIFLERGKGCRVWDVDGNEYIDFVQGLLPNILGYAHPEVNSAFSEQLALGHSFSMPHPKEVELAERLHGIVPCAEMVKFGKNGSDATAGAVRAARAFTGRDRIACCGYHGWQDWYIGSTTRSGGVPAAVKDLTHPFGYNDLSSLEAVLEAHSGEFAAVIMEPFNFTPPNPGYLEGVKALAHKHGALLIFDEICVGFHFGLGGAQKKFGVVPDLACFGKAMGNGFPIAAICGRRDVMSTYEDIFVSFTFAGEVASMAATLKVLDILENTDALSTIRHSGRTLQDGFNALAKAAGLADRFACIGYPEWSLMKFKDARGQDCLLTRSLFQQEAVKRGILHLVTHNMSAAHDSAAVQQTLEAYAAVFKTLVVWLSDAQPQSYLQGPMIQPVFRVR